MAERQDIPRWCRELAAEGFDVEATWERINELLLDGWDTTDVMREMKLPESKLRSLQQHARKFGPRRRLKLFGEFKDALLKGAVDNREKFIEALQLIAGLAVSPNVKPGTQALAFSLMLDLTKVLTRAVKPDIEDERQRKTEEGGRRTVDPAEAVEAIKRAYGLA